MGRYILSIDQGTTSSRAILFNKKGQLCYISQREVECFFPYSGWVESDPIAIWVSVFEVMNEVLIKANIKYSDIDSIGITNQRETTIVWEKETGLPVYNAIIWQSRQSSSICDTYAEKKDFIHQKTGLIINPYFSASKIRFILDHIPNGQQRAENGELLFGTVDSWLIYKLTNGKVHATDSTNASRTMLFNINTMKWDKELCKLFNIPLIMLPKVCPSSHFYGLTENGVKICGVAGDQQAALFGQTCFDEGEGKNTYGTGCFMLVNTGNKPIISKNGLLTTIGWQIGKETVYALEGSVFIGGAVVQWLRDGLKMIKESKESEFCAVNGAGSSGVYVVPAFVGLGTPYWDDDARGSVFGLTRSTNNNNFVAACLEAIAYQCKDVFEVMKKETKKSLKCLKVDGGASANGYLMQFQSDILQTSILLPKCLETTALGVAYLAGLNSGFFTDLNSIKCIHGYQNTFIPSMTVSEVKRRYDGWKKAVKATREFK